MSGRLLLLRHGQSYSNVERLLDTRPPGASLTPEGVAQARDFARAASPKPGLLLHSVARRAAETAAAIAEETGLTPEQIEGIHEVQVGDLEMRGDDDAVQAFNGIYERWHSGERDAAFPAGESANQVLDRYLPVLADIRARYLDEDGWTDDIVVVSHGAAIRLVAATLAGVDGSFVVEHHLTNAQAVVLVPEPDGAWSCARWGEHEPPFLPDPRGMPAPDEMESADPMG